jgi:hypothetical protein
MTDNEPQPEREPQPVADPAPGGTDDTAVDAAGIAYPHITVQLTGHDGNAYAIIGRIAKALRSRAGTHAADMFTEAAFACTSYDDLLALAMRTVDCR